MSFAPLFCFVEGLFRKTFASSSSSFTTQLLQRHNISHIEYIILYNKEQYTNDVFFFFFLVVFFLVVFFFGGGSKPPEKQNSSITIVISVVFKKDGDDDEKKKKKNFLGKIVIFDRIIGETESFDFGFR